jgi:Ca2+-binding RTX toxin-like protein
MADSFNDTINAGEGRNIVIGGGGNDTLKAGHGDNIIIGDNGSVAFAAPSVLVSIQTSDPVFGGSDAIVVGCGDNFILGGVGNDTIKAQDGDNVVLGDDGSLTFIASPVRVEEDWQTYGYRPVFVHGEDLTYAGGLLLRVQSLDPNVAGKDDITVGNGNNLVIGGGGNDTIGAGQGDNIIIGDSGAVQFNESGLLSSIQTSDAAYGGNDQIKVGCGNNIVLGGSGSDTILAGNGDNIIIGDNGEIVFGVPKYSTSVVSVAGDGTSLLVTSDQSAYGGNDQIAVGDGQNIVIAGSGNDTIRAGHGDNLIIGDNGSISFFDHALTAFIQSIDPSYGGDDQISVGCGDNIIIGGVGADIISAGDGNNIIVGDDGQITLRWHAENSGHDSAVKNDVDSVVVIAKTIDPGVGGADKITVGSGHNVLFGGPGNDLIKTARGGNIIFSGNGQVTFGKAEAQSVPLKDGFRGGVDKMIATDINMTVPVVDWSDFFGGNTRLGKADQGDGSPVWLDDFLNHLGQTAAERNPNADIRVRVDAMA